MATFQSAAADKRRIAKYVPELFFSAEYKHSFRLGEMQPVWHLSPPSNDYITCCLRLGQSQDWAFKQWGPIRKKIRRLVTVHA